MNFNDLEQLANRWLTELSEDLEPTFIRQAASVVREWDASIHRNVDLLEILGQRLAAAKRDQSALEDCVELCHAQSAELEQSIDRMERCPTEIPPWFLATVEAISSSSPGPSPNQAASGHQPGRCPGRGPGPEAARRLHQWIKPSAGRSAFICQRNKLYQMLLAMASQRDTIADDCLPTVRDLRDELEETRRKTSFLEQHPLGQLLTYHLEFLTGIERQLQATETLLESNAKRLGQCPSKAEPGQSRQATPSCWRQFRC
ncbi:uncharacterized protein LOC129757858 [Uranotaenia lowii]|uniref:uncharacterized protein LOC129757858 n=1 Tax=Uranotaenia lowii TaxID=190385 RepID=UPI00247A0D73|nr:uncharacterized protein LOC129757858 [Uranotaenia lowii]